MKTILVCAIILATSSAQQICQTLCDGDEASKAKNPRSAYSVSLSGRQIEIHISDESNVAFGTIKNGRPDDEVWLDRTWDGGNHITSNITRSKVSGGTEATTTVFNIDGDITLRQIGAIRACGKAKESDDTICTPLARSTKLAGNRVQAAATAMMMLYNSIGLWTTIGWWNSANCLTAIMEYQRVTGDETYSFVIGKTYDINVHRNFTSESVDDTAWWGLVWAEAYQITTNTTYLEEAKRINDFLHTFATDKCGGGIVWSAASQYKNAITNELFLKLSAVLHNIIPGDTKYLGWAKEFFDWFINSGMINGENLINDGLTDSCQNNKQTTWTYNQGVVLGAAVELYKATNDQKYLETARKIANAVVTSPQLSPSGILHEPCDKNGDNCGRDAPTFKGVFARNLSKLNAILADKPFTDYIRRNAQKISENGSSLGQYGLHYEGPFEFYLASTQQSALEMLVAAERAS